MYWSTCSDSQTDKIFLSEINGDSNFDIIPTNKNGTIKGLTIGMLRNIISITINETIRNESKEW